MDTDRDHKYGSDHNAHDPAESANDHYNEYEQYDDYDLCGDRQSSCES